MRIGSKTKAIGTVVASGILVIGISTSASAYDNIPAGNYGYAQWNANPSGSTPGDSLRACDTNADGYGVKAKAFNSNYDVVRTASTSGLSAGQCTSWKSGDLPEDNRFQIITYRVKDGNEIVLDHRFVSS
ncbi:hypothetical protein SAM40697_2666 [Streptomyces ambofaciens]|uniref:Secreted protein n=1 Tax=Streptomyces ambofaciens TaxID=1889 RepID=A0ABN4P5T5_STRAM|nr:hypothetical protein [Streptomyces ambofaciens]ANB06625.1 hypothetical protein SAM40697_2666 [Streptomyces ambofaciens]